MTVRELLQRLLDHVFDGRGALEPVLVRCDGELRRIAEVQVRVSDAPGLFVLMVADGPSPVSEDPATNLRPPLA